MFLVQMTDCGVLVTDSEVLAIVKQWVNKTCRGHSVDEAGDIWFTVWDRADFSESQEYWGKPVKMEKSRVDPLVLAALALKKHLK